MKIIYSLSIVGLNAVLLISGYFLFRTQYGGNAASQAKSESPNSQGLRVAPDFELPDSQGKFHKLQDFKGAPVVLHFWASWCPPCLDEISKWVELARADHGRPIHWVAVSLDQNWTDALKVWTPQAGIGNVFSLLDTRGKVSDQFGTYQFPETYLLNSDLEIITKWVGPQDWGGEELRNLLRRWLR